jgi:hypothetical protein
LKQLSQETGQPKLPVCAATKLLCWNPYKFTVAQNFQAAGYAGRVRFCNWFCEAVCSEVVCLLNSLADEEQVYLNSHKDIQNKRYYWVDNPRLLHGMHCMTLEYGMPSVSQTYSELAPFWAQWTEEGILDRVLHHFLKIQ